MYDRYKMSLNTMQNYVYWMLKVISYSSNSQKWTAQTYLFLLCSKNTTEITEGNVYKI